MRKLIFALILLCGCTKEPVVPACEIEPLNSNWQMISKGALTDNELNLPFGFEFSITPIGDEYYQFQTDIYTDTLLYAPDTINAPETYTFVGGASNIFHIAFTIDNEEMELYFSSPYQDILGTSIYYLDNTDCPIIDHKSSFLAIH